MRVFIGCGFMPMKWITSFCSPVYAFSRAGKSWPPRRTNRRKLPPLNRRADCLARGTYRRQRYLPFP